MKFKFVSLKKMFPFRNSNIHIGPKTLKAVHYLQKVLYCNHAEYVDASCAKPEWIAYSHAKQGNFLQAPPKLQNPYVSDQPLRSYLRHHVPEEVSKEIESDLKPFGDRIVNEIDALGWECECNLPVLHHQNAWGQRVDELITCSAWKKQHDISAEEGLVAIGYERKLHQWSRLHQACKLYLYSPSAGLYTCPLAMTDGAAKTIEVIDTKQRFRNSFENLTSRDPAKFWTSGQWMTEKRGGSDVAGGTETVAIADADFYRLYGYKWFTSATDSNMALTLAQVKESDENEKGLTMFYLETKNSEGNLNNLQLVRLKNKLGTRQVPTAELLLDGSIAYKMSERGDGIAAISNMLTITRLYNAISSVAAMRRVLMLARDYSHHRKAFGKPLYKFPLHVQILSRMEVKVRGCLLLMMKTAVLLGKVESDVATADEVLLLRLLLPVLKLYTAKQAVSVVSEGIEAFGGQGYMEDTGLPVLLRDCQVLPIWEGTTNILSLDVLRSFSKSNFETLYALHRSIASCIENAQNRDLCISCANVNKSIKYILDFVQTFPEQLNVACRDLSYSIAKTYIGALLIENANTTNSPTDIISAKRWCELQDLCLLSNHHNFLSYTEGVHGDTELVMEGYIP
ncbi:acyl-CoA dehydrogenase family member 11-like isoform X1 [Uloborus diversus]|uniref:acyl-CoA dehydrogenase family member 11-like isoform X1 n=1 Tax=Uloborus diversus TaxID=327109 RepID=UPI00240A1363|nr:acyl-CoA dehydrogenase family member 11-like isoform X1 [Uloborus diversus]